MAAGYAAIANDGTYVQPHLIKATISGTDGPVTPAPAPETHRVLQPGGGGRSCATMMEAVVDARARTGTQARVDGYRVAGKTGTGKRLIDGQYTKHNAGSFIGMAPADNPRYVIAVFADVPHGTGGDVAAPAFSKMMASDAAALPGAAVRQPSRRSSSCIREAVRWRSQSDRRTPGRV